MRFFFHSPFLLYSYLTTEILAPFFAAFVIMNGVFFLAKLLPFLNFSLELGIGFADFIRLFSYMFPNILLYTIPMAAMLGIIIGFSRLSSDSEILAFKASGITLYHMIPPVFLVAALLATFTGYLSIKLIPVSEIAMRQLTYQLLKEKIGRGVKEYRFSEALGELVIHVDKISKEDGRWENVWISDMRAVKTPTITMAPSGMMQSDLEKMMVTIVLNNGSLHRPGEDDAQIVTFDKYTINIPLQLPSGSAKSVRRGTMTMDQLIEKTKEYGLETKKGRSMLVEYHERLVLPFGCLIISLLALPLGLQAGPGKKAIGIPFGLGVFIIYYALFSMGKMQAKYNLHGALDIGLLVWMPNIFFALITGYCIFRIFGEKPLLPERLHILARTIGEHISIRISKKKGPFPH